MIPVYERGGIRIVHGDVVEALRPLLDYPTDGGAPVRPFDLAIVDPPYNVGKTYDLHDDRITDERYRWWCALWFDVVRDLAKRVVIFPGHGNLPMWFDIRKPSAIGCWFKPGNPASSHLGWSEWEPWLYWGTRVGGSDTLRATITKQRGVGDHPCPKPLELSRLLLKKFKPANLLAPMFGSGTDLVAAAEAGIPAFGVELSPHYCDIAATRLNAVFDAQRPAGYEQPALFMGSGQLNVVPDPAVKAYI